MTIQQVIDELNKIPMDKRDLPLYACNLESNNNFKVESISLFDSEAEHDNDNMLAVNFIN